jgi:hypothetical protein
MSDLDLSYWNGLEIRFLGRGEIRPYQVQYLIAEQLFEQVARFVLAGIIVGTGHILASGQLKIFTEIRHMLFGDRIGAALAALVRHSGIMMSAIMTNFQIGAAALTRFQPTGRADEFVIAAAFPTMSCDCHHHEVTVGAFTFPVSRDSGFFLWPVQITLEA